MNCMFWKRENKNWMIITIPLPEIDPKLSKKKREQLEKERMLRLYVQVKCAVLEDLENF